MQFRKITQSQLVLAIDQASREHGYELTFAYTSGKDGNFRGRIVPETSFSPGARRAASGMRLKAACWHAHRDVLANLFAIYPGALVRTSMATYNGAEGFAREFPETAHANIGSAYRPATMPELCDCDYC